MRSQRKLRCPANAHRRFRARPGLEALESRLSPDVGAASVIPFPTPLQAVAPLGSFVYQVTQTGTIASGGATDSFTLPVNAPQRVTVVVRPSGALKPSVDLSRDGTVVQSGTADAPGQAIIFQSVPTPIHRPFLRMSDLPLRSVSRFNPKP